MLQRAKSLKAEGLTYNEIVDKLKPEYPDVTYDKVREACRDRVRKERQEVVGVIGDTHFPFAHPNYINFLEDTFKKHRVTKIIHIGDICDNHAISRWQKEADSYGACQEFDLALRDVEIYTRAFPNVTLLLGNHCRIPERQAATLGIPSQYLKGTKELWKLPKGWDVDEQVILNDVKYEHGIGSTGVNGAANNAVASMMSTVIGHQHSFGGVQYRSNSKHLIFGMNVGCGIDIDAYAFRYGRYAKHRPTLGCGIVYDSSHATFVPMGWKYFRKRGLADELHR